MNKTLNIFIFLASIYVLFTAIRIEILNSRAGNYLPRNDIEDGTWRVSRSHSPRDQLCNFVQTWGIFQYLIAPFLLCASIRLLIKYDTLKVKLIFILPLLISLCGMYLMFYRGYFTSVVD